MNIISFFEKSNKYWKLKPFWCKPFSIIITGIFILIIGFKIFSMFWIRTIISLIIFSWWALFLIIAPYSYDQIELPD
ncbi:MULTISPECIES: DUF6737 family protein [unclassified Prochlorococcus]|uniref:DUF6737 family protein n=1 Tax=unclassified Prochlorococcus TaxID=2627481 RepID=UPI00068FFFAA